jgi:hypothetical protein
MNFSFTPANNYFDAMGFLYSIGLESQGLNQVEAAELGREIVQLAREDVKNRPYSSERQGQPSNLAASIQYEVSGGKLRLSAGGEMAPYAKWVEHGSSRAEPHPFLYPAIQAVLSMRETARGIQNGIINRAQMRAPSLGRKVAGGASMIPMSGYRMRAGGEEGLSGLLALGAVGMTAMSGMFAISSGQL